MRGKSHESADFKYPGIEKPPFTNRGAYSCKELKIKKSDKEG